MLINELCSWRVEHSFSGLCSDSPLTIFIKYTNILMGYKWALHSWCFYLMFLICCFPCIMEGIILGDRPHPVLNVTCHLWLLATPYLRWLLLVTSLFARRRPVGRNVAQIKLIFCKDWQCAGFTLFIRTWTTKRKEPKYVTMLYYKVPTLSPVSAAL